MILDMNPLPYCNFCSRKKRQDSVHVIPPPFEKAKQKLPKKHRKRWKLLILGAPSYNNTKKSKPIFSSSVKQKKSNPTKNYIIIFIAISMHYWAAVIQIHLEFILKFFSQSIHIGPNFVFLTPQSVCVYPCWAFLLRSRPVSGVLIGPNCPKNLGAVKK